MSINKPDQRVWPTDYWLFCDPSQYTRNRDYWDSYTGIILNSTSVNHTKPNSMQIRNLGGMGFSRNLDEGFHIGRSSVYVAMQVAYWMKYEHIFILGVDMCSVVVDGKPITWHYGQNPDVTVPERLKRFENEAKNY